jgi:hypothetical protein
MPRREGFSEWDWRKEVQTDWQTEQRCRKLYCGGNSRNPKGHDNSKDEKKDANPSHREQRAG